MKSDKKIVILCTSRIYDSQVHGFIEKLNIRLAEQDTVLLIFTINSDLYWDESKISAETMVFDIIPYDSAEAVIIMDEKIKSHSISQKIIKESCEHGKPVIVIDGKYDNVLHVNYDYGAGFEKVVRHVMSCRDIKKPHIIAGFKDNPFSDERIDIFKKMIEEYGFTFDDNMLSYGDFWAVPARNATEKLIESGDIPDAIICANDIMAINVSDVLQQHGISVPDDVIVSGFDGYDEVFITTPKITTVSCTTPGLADATAEMVLNIVRKGNADSEQDVYVIPELITNESTGCEAQSGYDHFMLARFNNMFYRHNDETRIMHEISTKMQMSSSPDEMVSHLTKLIVNDQNMMDDVIFVINNKVFDIGHYYFDRVDKNIKLEDCNMVYDSSVSDKLLEKNVDKTLMRMDNESFRNKISCGYPLIFNVLDYLDSPLGYICYNYLDYDITKYCRTANITNAISMGIGGYINSKYQQSLVVKVDDMYKKDSLTGLYNRQGFSNAFGKIVEDRNFWGKPITVIMSDLDGLKYINDNFGHAEGDNAIYTAAQVLKSACPEKAICVRFGGDELFSVIIGECDINFILKKIEVLLSEYNRNSNKEYAVVASCGSNTSVLDEKFDIKNALRIADEQMYNIKRNHRN